MTHPVALWHDEHLRFGHVLDVLEEQLVVFHGGGSPDYGLMVDVLSYLRDIGDGRHHPRENVAFERMVARDETLRLPVNRLLQEHRVILAAGIELADLLREIVEDTIVPRETVEAAAALYLTYYRHHLRTEERDILPRASRLLRAEDWDAATAAVASGTDPLFDESPQARYRDLLAAVQARMHRG